MSQDEAVIATNDDATLCKRYAVHKGYWKDDYIQYFAKVGNRKAPEISRGYYARVKAVRLLIEQFLSLTKCNCQVVSLGAGSDSLFWQLKVEDKAPKAFFEADFGTVTGRKCFSIRSRKQLHQAFSDDDGLRIDGNEAHSKDYHLVAVDLRDVHTLESKLADAGLNKGLPTLFLAECVLVYMEPEKSAAIIDWVGRNFKTALFINYEQVNMQDRFGQVMVQNLKGRHCELPGAYACVDVEAQKQRFLSNHWEDAQASDMLSVYQCLPADDKQRMEKLEFLDEVDLLHQLLNHYCMCWAFNDAAKLGLEDIGF